MYSVKKHGEAEPSENAKLVASIDYLNAIESILEKEMTKPNTSFKMAKRIDFKDLTPGLVERDVIQNGIPVVVTNVMKNWNKELFGWKWLKEHFGDWEMISSPRDTQALEDLTGWTVSDYIDYLDSDPTKRKRNLYGKDITCPEPWRNYMASHLNAYFCYEHRDLVSHLSKYVSPRTCLIPREQQPETLMVYTGTENTYTPGHTDICGSLGHNLMVYSDKDSYALWFVAESKDKQKAAVLWGRYGAALDHDNCFLPVEKLAEADFPFYIIRQRLGDLVFVPPEGAHQVINKGGRSTKIAWNRITPTSISGSYHDVLPVYHEICKAEVYRIKTLAYMGLKHRIKRVNEGKTEERFLYEFPPLIKLFDEIICEEWISAKVIRECGAVEKERFEDRVPHLRTCNFCNADIFNRCYRCPVCTDDYDVCLRCIAEGRGCKHNAELLLMEHVPMTVCFWQEVSDQKELKNTLEEAAKAYETVALSLNQPHTPVPPCDFNEDTNSIATLAYQMVSRYKSAVEYRCHQCKRRKRQQYMVDCSINCGKSYCAMCLWNRYGIKQVTAQRNRNWQCPHCLKTCNCAACLRKRDIDPKEHEVLAAYKALLDISVVVPPAFSRNSDAVAGVCDSAPKPARSQGYSVTEMERAKNLRAKGEVMKPQPILAPGKARREAIRKLTMEALRKEYKETGEYNIRVKDEFIVDSESDGEEKATSRKRARSVRKQQDSVEEDEYTPGGSVSYIEEDPSFSKRGPGRPKGSKNKKMPEVEPPPPPPPQKKKNRKSEPKPPSKKRKTEPTNNKKAAAAAPIQRTDHYIPNDFLPMDYESSVLTFSHPGVTYDEYIRIYNDRSKRERRIFKDETNKVFTYWCFCGLVRHSSQFFASHAKVCPVYKACMSDPRSPNDPVFLKTDEPKLLEDGSDSNYTAPSLDVDNTLDDTDMGLGGSLMPSAIMDFEPEMGLEDETMDEIQMLTRRQTRQLSESGGLGDWETTSGSDAAFSFGSSEVFPLDNNPTGMSELFSDEDDEYDGDYQEFSRGSGKNGGSTHSQPPQTHQPPHLQHQPPPQPQQPPQHQHQHQQPMQIHALQQKLPHQQLPLMVSEPPTTTKRGSKGNSRAIKAEDTKTMRSQQQEAKRPTATMAQMKLQQQQQQQQQIQQKHHLHQQQHHQLQLQQQRLQLQQQQLHQQQQQQQQQQQPRIIFVHPVWVKVPGLPWWPAAEIQNHNLPKALLDSKPPDISTRPVFFFATNKPYIWCTPNQMLPFQRYIIPFFKEIQGHRTLQEEQNLAPPIIERLLRAIINLNHTFNYTLIEEELWQQILREHVIAKSQVSKGALLGMPPAGQPPTELTNEMGMEPGMGIPGIEGMGGLSPMMLPGLGNLPMGMGIGMGMGMPGLPTIGNLTAGMGVGVGGLVMNPGLGNIGK